MRTHIGADVPASAAGRPQSLPNTRRILERPLFRAGKAFERPRVRFQIGARASQSIMALLFVAVACVSSAQPIPPAIPAVLTLEWCLDRGRKANPDLAIVEATASAAEQRIRPARALEDPRIAYEASNVPVGDFDFNSTPLSGHQLAVTQKLPLPGLLSNRGKAATREAEASALLAEHQRLVTDGEIETAWAELGFAQRALDITRRNIDLLRQLSATAESRYRVGHGLQPDVLRAQVDLTVLLQEQLQRDQSVAQAEARLVALLDLPADTQLPKTADLSQQSAVPDLPPLLSGIESTNPRLRSAQKAVEQASFQIRVAELEGLPDVDLGVGYRIRANVPGDPVHGDDFLSAGVTIRLPLDRSKWRARVAERRALLRRAQAQLRGVRARLFSGVRSAHAELTRAASEEVLLETGLIPQAQLSLDASHSAYQVGRIEFLSLLDSQLRLIDAERRLARARADKRVAFAALEVASGGRLR